MNQSIQALNWLKTPTRTLIELQTVEYDVDICRIVIILDMLNLQSLQELE